MEFLNFSLIQIHKKCIMRVQKKSPFVIDFNIIRMVELFEFFFHYLLQLENKLHGFFYKMIKDHLKLSSVSLYYC